jgi:hypothetical protein
MLEFNSSTPPQRSLRRVEKELRVSDDHEEEIIDNLVDTVDELRIFSMPIATQRTVEDVPVYQLDTQLPSRYSLLNMTQVVLDNGTYKTKITIPGGTMTLEGSHANESGIWRVYAGDTEKDLLEHSDAINYLRSILPVRPNLDKLADIATVDDQTINAALWQDLSPLTATWTDASYYNATQDQYVPSFINGMPLPGDKSKTIDDDEDYISSIAAVVGYIETSKTKKYTCRLGTQLPIDLSLPDNSIKKQKPLDVHQEHSFSVEFNSHDPRMRNIIATLAIESDFATTRHLHDLVDTTAIYLDDVPAIYSHATDIVKNKYLDPSGFEDLKD